MKRLKGPTLADWLSAVIVAEDEALDRRYRPAWALTPRTTIIEREGIRVIVDGPRRYEEQDGA